MTPTYAPTSSALPDTVAVAVSLQWRKVMNPLMRLFLKTLPEAPADPLAATLKPRPDLRDRRFAKWPMDRRERYLAAAYGEPISLQRRAGRLTATSSALRVSDAPNSADTRLCVSGAGSSAAIATETGGSFPAHLDQTCGVSPAVKQARISNPMTQTERN